MAPRKRQRNDTCSPPPASRTIPVDLLLEIAARSDARTIVRFAAACKILRRGILADAFIRRQAAAGVVPSCVLARLHNRRHMHRRGPRKPAVSLVHPATPVTSSFVGKHLAPFVSRSAADRYGPVASRGGLVLLRRRRHLRRRNTSGSDLCVYDPMSGARTFLSEPPDICMDDESSVRSCVLLTPADGIGCSSFLLLVADRSIHPLYWPDGPYTMRVQTAASLDANGVSWRHTCSGPFQEDTGAVVLQGGVVHWLNGDQDEIFSYDIRTRQLGTLEHPHMSSERHLAVSPDGSLRILFVYGFTISIWLRLSTGDWAEDAAIDTEDKMRSLDPSVLSRGLILRWLSLQCSGETKSNGVLLQIDIDGPIVVLDLETREMRLQEDSSSSFLFEVDLPARLHALKVFS